MTEPTPSGFLRTPQRELLARLRELGIDARAEATLPAHSPRSRSGLFRVDAMVIRKGRPWLAIECKATTRPLKGRQRENYDECGLPYVVAGHDNLDELIRAIEAAYDSGSTDLLSTFRP